MRNRDSIFHNENNAVRTLYASVTAATIILVASGCAGNGDDLDANGRPIDGSSPQPIPLEATLASIQQNIFTPTCATSGCHSGSASPMGLQLDAGVAFNSLINVSSTEQPSIQRVATGDPDNSYLVQKISGTAAVGARMPIGQPVLPESTIEVIRTWIAEGANQ